VEDNTTLITLRNAGKVALEITDVLAVRHSGEVVKQTRLQNPLKLGPQQSITLRPDQIGMSEYTSYQTAVNTVSTFYFKTFRGRVFGSTYIAPPSLERPAFKTETYTTYITETSEKSLTIIKTTEIITSWTATVIIDNPSHWPVYTYVGVAFPRDYQAYRGYGSKTVYPDIRFPAWGVLPGFQAKNQRDQVVPVTPNDVGIPRYVSCSISQSVDVNGRYYRFNFRWRPSNPPITVMTELGPVWVAEDIQCPGDANVMDPPPDKFYPNYSGENMGTSIATANCSGTSSCTGSFNVPSTYNVKQIKITANAEAATRVPYYHCVWYRGQRQCSLVGYTNTDPSPIQAYVDTPWGRAECTATKELGSNGNWVYNCSSSLTVNNSQGPASLSFGANFIQDDAVDTGYYVRPSSAIRIQAQITIVYEGPKPYSFPGSIEWRGEYRDQYRYWYVTNVYALAYVAVVDYWNTSNVLQVFYPSQGNTRFEIKIDRPVGIAAVYVFSRSEARLPPPPPPPPQPGCGEVAGVNICIGSDVRWGDNIRKTSSSFVTYQCGSQPPDRITVTFQGRGSCNVYVAPGAGTYSTGEAQPCENRNGQITCTVPPGTTLIPDCDPTR